MVRRLILIALCAVLAIGGYVWWKQSTDAQTQAKSAAPPAPPPAEVGIMTTQAVEVPLTVTYSGRVASYRDVEIRPQVSGILLERAYEDGAKVNAGQVLFRIDRRPYEVARDRARAQLAQAEATSRQADDNFKRIEELVRRQVSTEQAFEQARTARDQAQAGVQLAQAELNNAELNLGYTVISAPVSANTALQSPQVGSLIQAQQTLLTTLTQLDPAYVNFSITDTEFQAFRALNEQRAKPITESDLDVELQDGSGTLYPSHGKVQVSASNVDMRTGTIQVRTIFPNANGALLPGQFVRVVIRGITLPKAVVVPKQAISQGPQGPFVYVVNDKDSAQVRPVKLGQEVPAGWVIQSGLDGAERVIVDGLIRVRPGATVRPGAMQANATPAKGEQK
ncbi:MAG: efflux transporter periplasmic adaptor subunit [Hyphomicrobiales bacterium]|nr:efflux transporter periplasmic adaptor subunit [Hyphomicrobiales bacterium]